MGKLGFASLAVGLALAGAARAEVVDATAGGFDVRETVEIGASAQKVWRALGHYGDWWSSKHTWSGDAKNVTLDLDPGGCLCEALPHGGSVQHMTVIFLAPEKRAILSGTLGPLMFSGASGHLIWTLAEKDGRTTLTQEYIVGGYIKGGLGALAPDVDAVLGEEVRRLKAYVETGKAS